VWLPIPVAALAPATAAAHMSSPLFDLAFKLDLDHWIELAGGYNLMPNTGASAKIAAAVCALPSHWLAPCKDVLQLAFGYNSSHFNSSDLNVYLSHVPAGTSIFDFGHFAQLWKVARDGQPKFVKYDYGTAGNMRRYGVPKPPEYQLHKIADGPTKLALYSGSIDTLADPRDVEWLVSSLGAPPLVWRKLDGYGHLDFVWGDTAAQDVYPEVIELLQSHIQVNHTLVR